MILFYIDTMLVLFTRMMYYKTQHDFWLCGFYVAVGMVVEDVRRYVWKFLKWFERECH